MTERKNKMPVFKFRTYEEAEKAQWNFHPDEVYFLRVARLFEFAQKVNPVHYPRGIFKYRSIEDANRQSEEWLSEHCLKRNLSDSIEPESVPRLKNEIAEASESIPRLNS